MITVACLGAHSVTKIGFEQQQESAQIFESAPIRLFDGTLFPSAFFHLFLLVKELT